MKKGEVLFFDDRHYVKLSVEGESRPRYFRSTSEVVNYCNDNNIEAEVICR